MHMQSRYWIIENIGNVRAETESSSILSIPGKMSNFGIFKFYTDAWFFSDMIPYILES